MLLLSDFLLSVLDADPAFAFVDVDFEPADAVLLPVSLALVLLPEVEPEVEEVVAPDEEDNALEPVFWFEPKPLPLFWLDPNPLPLVVLPDDDALGLLDELPVEFDMSLELWFFSVSFIV